MLFQVFLTESTGFVKIRRQNHQNQIQHELDSSKSKVNSKCFQSMFKLFDKISWFRQNQTSTPSKSESKLASFVKVKRQKHPKKLRDLMFYIFERSFKALKAFETPFKNIEHEVSKLLWMLLTFDFDETG